MQQEALPVGFSRGFVDVQPLRQNPAFRRLFLGSALSGFGAQLTVVAVLYQAWELTRNPLAVGAIGLAQAVPSVLLGLAGGSLADVVDRRRIAIAATAGQMFIVALLAVQAEAEVDSIWLLYLLVALLAAFSAVGAPAWRSFPARLLSPQLLGGGLALSHLGFQAALLLGPVLGGLLIAQAGISTAYLVDAATFAAPLYAAWRLPRMLPAQEPGKQRPQALLMGGLQLVARRPLLRGALLTDVCATLLAMPVALFPAINEERFGGDPATLGLFFSAIAVGGISAGALSGFATRASRTGNVLLIAATGWGLALAGFGVAQPLWVALACLSLAGAADTISVICRGTIVQLATPDSFRGRVNAVDHVVGVSGPDLGNFRSGLVAGATSPTIAAASGGLMCVAAIGLLALTHPSLRRFKISDPSTVVASEASATASHP
jgi:MFS family permease